jgi:hypothetical protein
MNEMIHSIVMDVLSKRIIIHKLSPRVEIRINLSLLKTERHL